MTSCDQDTSEPPPPQLARGGGEPLYRQLARILRHRVFTGALPPGSVLPPIREAETLWGVHYHTVRRAYGELAGEGLVESRPGFGTRVRSPQAGRDSLSNHLDRFLQEVEAIFGAGPREVADLLAARRATAAPRPTGPLWVVECSALLAGHLAETLLAKWDVDARGWPLDRLGVVPDGPVLTTHFHAREVADRLADRHRDGDVEAVGVQLDPEQTAAILEAFPGARIALCERDGASGHGIADDLRRLFRDAADVEVILPRRIADALEIARAGRPVLFVPGAWERLTPEERESRGAFLLPVRFNPADEPTITAFLARGARPPRGNAAQA